MRLQVGCELRWRAGGPNPAVLLVRPRDDWAATVVDERLTTEPAVAVAAYRDPFGNRCDRLVIPEGESVLRYSADIEIDDGPDPTDPGAVQHPIEDLPDEALQFLLPSRYCLSDEMMGTAWDLFGSTTPGWGRVQAVCDWVFGHLGFRYGASNPLTTAKDVYEAGEGVCRDFTQLAVTFCRALNVPTRYAFGYLADVDVPVNPHPMDFCAWMEVYLGGRWWTFDPRNNDTMPRKGRVLIGRGRDALDVAMVTTYGAAELAGMSVIADVAEEVAA